MLRLLKLATPEYCRIFIWLGPTIKSPMGNQSFNIFEVYMNIHTKLLALERQGLILFYFLDLNRKKKRKKKSVKKRKKEKIKVFSLKSLLILNSCIILQRQIFTSLVCLEKHRILKMHKGAPGIVYPVNHNINIKVVKQHMTK